MKALEHRTVLDLPRHSRCQLVVDLGVLRDYILIRVTLRSTDFSALELFFKVVLIFDEFPDAKLKCRFPCFVDFLEGFILQLLELANLALVRVNHDVFDHVNLGKHVAHHLVVVGIQPV